VVTPDLSGEERVQLKRSADVLREAIGSLS
jgi:hypothetical protein